MRKGTIAAVFIILILLSVTACGPSEAELAATEDAIRETEEAEATGTNADFGTRCVFNDVELWRFDE